MTKLNKTNFTIRLKRGLAANINTAATKLLALEGEPYWTTDTDQLHIYNGDKNIRIGGNKPVETRVANYTPTSSDEVILCDTTISGVVISLPTVSGNPGLHFYVKKINSGGNTVTISGLDFIDNSLTREITTQYDSIHIVSDESKWSIIDHFVDTPTIDGVPIDDIFLKLDASNDPITGDLLLTPDSDSISVFQVNQADSTVVLNVDTINSGVIIQQNSTTFGPLNIYGKGLDGSTDNADGVAFALNHNATNNRQLVLGPTDWLGDNSKDIFRFTFSSITTLSSVSGDGVTRRNTYIGSDTTSSIFGVSSIKTPIGAIHAYSNSNFPAGLVGFSTGETHNAGIFRAHSTQTANLVEFQKSDETVEIRIAADMLMDFGRTRTITSGITGMVTGKMIAAPASASSAIFNPLGFAIDTSGSQTINELRVLKGSFRHLASNTLTAGYAVWASASNAGIGNATLLAGGIFFADAGGAGNVSALYGTQYDIRVTNASTTVQSAEGLHVFWTFSAGTVTNARGVYVTSPVSTAATMTNLYGLQIDTMSGATNNWAIFTGGGLVEFNDQLTVDGSADRIQLKVQAHSTQTANLIELQDSDANVLTHFSKDGSLSVGSLVNPITDTQNLVTFFSDNAFTATMWLRNLALSGNQSARFILQTREGQWFFGTDMGAANWFTIKDNTNNFTPGNYGVSSTSRLFVNHASFGTYITTHADVVGFMIKANSTQTANIVEVQDSSANVLSGVDERGVPFADLNTHANKRNYFAGNDAGNVSATGDQNVAVGYKAGSSITDGESNVFIGASAGINNLGGDQNVGLGNGALEANTTGSNNMAIGRLALNANQTQGSNVAIGLSAMAVSTGSANCVVIGKNSASNLTSGDDNVFIGFEAGRFNTTGGRSVAIGHSAGRGVSGNAHSENVFIGNDAGIVITTGSNNTLVGQDSGKILSAGATNIFLGNTAGDKQTTASNLLIVDNQTRTDTATELTNSILYGIMAATPALQSLRVNAVTTIHEDLIVGPGTKVDGFTVKDSAEVQTTDGTQTTLDSITLLDENTYHIKAYVVSVKSDGTDRASYELSATAYRTGAGVATLEGTMAYAIGESDVNWNAFFTASGNDIRVTVSGVAATTIEWGCSTHFINISN